MFLTELEKYPGDMPVVSLFEEVDKEAFVLLLEYSAMPELRQALAAVPPMRPDIRAIIANVMREKTEAARPPAMPCAEWV
ncbi:MAG: hypothetical protein JNL13_06755 [Chitinophagaceae bacterium]|nr:hypothetical protein [Chitinophagaceae bacterium]